VASLEQLVGSPVLSPVLSYVTRPRASPAVEGVALVEDVGRLDQVAAGAIVLLTRTASSSAGSYRFDVALRVARSRGVAALVLCGSDVANVSSTASAIADRCGVAILGVDGETDLGWLAMSIGRELAGGAEAALLRAHTAMRAVEAHPPDAPPEGLIEHAGAAMGVPIAMVDAEPISGPGAPIADGMTGGPWLVASAQDGDLGLALDLVLSIAAAGVQQVLARAAAAQDLPIQSHTDVLTQLLAVPPEARDALVHRARTLGVPIDDWHVAVRLEFEELADAPALDAVAAHHARLALARATLQVLSVEDDGWYGARSGLSAVLVHTFPEDPGAGASGAVAGELDEALRQVRDQMPTTLVHCGVGSAHAGPGGLLSSAAEAKAAATAARMSRRTGSAVPFDSVGLRRTLVEWYASDTAQEAVTSVLAPLVELGGARAQRLIQTLHVYLDEQGSLTRSAEVLNLHRNAVSYRVNQIFSLLDVDPDNPDDRLLLQLACRARGLAS
jgi:sugar diacid utilization regulator